MKNFFALLVFGVSLSFCLSLANVNVNAQEASLVSSIEIRFFSYVQNENSMSYTPTYVDKKIDIKDIYDIGGVYGADNELEAFREGFSGIILGSPEAAVFNEDYFINSIEKAGNVAIIDFSDGITFHGLGTTGEIYFIQTIVNTVGKHFNVDYVRITSNGIAYESGHILMPEEGFRVN